MPLPCWRSEIMDTINGERLLAQLNWRYATKEFDPSRKISLKDWAALENALILSPSSYGLQPWRFVVISDQKMREKLFPSTWRQRQILDCSHFVVFAVRTAMTETDIDRHIARTAEVRGGTEEALKRFRDVVSGPRAAASARLGSAASLPRARNFYDQRSAHGNRHLPNGRIRPR
jgi:nitroreductase